MKNKLYLKTAEFALLCGTTKDTLIHYDEIDLLKPHHVTENKYRYYNINQVEEYFTISGLKNLGFSLQDIKAKLQHSSASSYCDLLEQQEETIENKIQELEQTKESIASHRTEIKQYLESGTNKIIIRNMPQKNIILSPNITSVESPHIWIHYYSELINTLKTKTKNIYCRYGAIKEKEALLTKQNDLYKNFYLRTTKEMSLDIIPSGTFLITYEKTDFENIIPAYERLIHYGDEHNMQLDSVFYEEVLIHQASFKAEEYIVQIMCRIL